MQNGFYSIVNQIIEMWSGLWRYLSSFKLNIVHWSKKLIHCIDHVELECFSFFSQEIITHCILYKTFSSINWEPLCEIKMQCLSTLIWLCITCIYFVFFFSGLLLSVAVASFGKTRSFSL